LECSLRSSLNLGNKCVITKTNDGAVSNTLLIVTEILVSSAGLDQTLDAGDRAVGYALVVLGSFGALFMIKSNGLIPNYMGVAREAGKELKSLVPHMSFLTLQKQVAASEPSFWRIIDHLRLWYLWFLLFCLVHCCRHLVFEPFLSTAEQIVGRERRERVSSPAMNIL